MTIRLDRNGGLPPGGDADKDKVLPVTDAHLTGYGASKADAKRGYSKGRKPADDEYGPMFGGPGGFAGRPQGWER